MGNDLLTTITGEADTYPLSFSQERLWILAQLEEDTDAAFHIAQAYRLQGTLNIAVLEKCINEIFARHEILRTCFIVQAGQPVMQVMPPPLFKLPLHPCPLADNQDEMSAIRPFLDQEIRRPFQLDTDILIRPQLFQINTIDHILLITAHQIVCDEQSMELFGQELFARYQTHLTTLTPMPLVPLPIQYGEYARQQREQSEQERQRHQLAYWEQQLAYAPSLLELPTDKPRPAIQTYRGATYSFTLPGRLVKSLRNLSNTYATTLSTILLTTFKVMLWRYTSQTDIIVGVQIHNRNHPKLAQLIGYLADTVALRTTLSGQETVPEALNKVQAVWHTANKHQDISFAQLLQTLQIQRNLNHFPIFQVHFAWQNSPTSLPRLSELVIHPIWLEPQTTLFDISLRIKDDQGVLKVTFTYNTELFQPMTIERMSGHFLQLLTAMGDHSPQPVSRLPLLTASEQKQLIHVWNKPYDIRPHDPCIHTLFSEQAARTPEATAVVFGRQTLTYSQLNQRANQLAHYLQKLGVGPGALVGIFMERSLDMIISVLGILKAGGIYVPLDPNYPQGRVMFMIEDAQTKVIMTQLHLVANLAPQHACTVCCLDTAWEEIKNESSLNPVNLSHGNDAVYVIYTSGSTGRPKGVFMNHRALSNLISWQCRHSRTDTRTLQYASLNFDVSFQEMFSTWLSGGTLVLIEEGWRQDPIRLLTYLQTTYIERVFLPYVALQQLAQTAREGRLIPSSLREIITAGEQLQITPDITALLNTLPHCVLYNQYGPSETHVVTMFTLPTTIKNVPLLPPIGRPIDNVQTYVLDAELQPVPIGVPGELFIGGICLGRGYHHRPQLTAEKFIPDPFSNLPGARLYKSGDLAQFSPDGNIVFLGRRDQQLKIRGFRVELGEIEAILNQYPLIKVAVVTVFNKTLLVAYIVIAQERAPTSSELRLFLKERLPEYMIPQTFERLESVPTTPSGKLDRRALPEPVLSRASVAAHFVEPSTPTEKTVCQIWSQVLNIPQIGIHDNFFELGGHSLLLTKVKAQLDQAFQVKIPFHKFFTAPTIAEQSVMIVQQKAAIKDEVALEKLLLELEQLSEKEAKMLSDPGLFSSENIAQSSSLVVA